MKGRWVIKKNKDCFTVFNYSAAINPILHNIATQKLLYVKYCHRIFKTYFNYTIMFARVRIFLSTKIALTIISFLTDVTNHALQELTVANVNQLVNAKMEDHVIQYQGNATAQKDGR